MATGERTLFLSRHLYYSMETARISEETRKWAQTNGGTQRATLCTYEYLANFRRTAASSSASMPLHLSYQQCQF